jgi:hypothetical protein
VVVKTVGARQLRQSLLTFRGKRIIEAFARAPEKASARFPNGRDFLVKTLRLEPEAFEQMARQVHGRTLPDTGHANVRTADNPHVQPGQPSFESERGEQTCAAITQNNDGGNHYRDHSR